MAEMPNVDPNFEPQTRPRCGTWPLNRPNIESRKSRMQQGDRMMLDATLEETSSQEMLANEAEMVMEPLSVKEENLSLFSQEWLGQSDLDNVLVGSPTANRVTDFSAITAPVIKQDPGANSSNMFSDYSSSTTITELSNMKQNQNFESMPGLQQQQASMSCQSNPIPTTGYSSPSINALPKLSSPTTTGSSSQLSTTTTGATPKSKSTRKNAWGNMSYADLITQAIESSPEQRLTLAQIYEWMVKNVPYFKDKGDSNSSAGWKNSIRHNLSLHNKFKRIQNEGTGKSSWWVINHDAKQVKPTRRRVSSMDNASAKYNRSRSKAVAKQKAELLKKKNAELKSGQSVARGSGSWGREMPPGLETPISKALGSDYRPRASSNASSLGGRLSPTHRFIAHDLEDDDTVPPLSPPGPSALANLSTSLPSAFNIFDLVRPENSPSTIPEGITADIQNNLLESLASMDVTYQRDSDCKDMSGMFMQGMNGNNNPNSSNVAQNTPHLASLLQSKTNVAQKNQPGTGVTKMEPQSYELDGQKATPYPYAYQNQPMGQLQSPPQYKSAIQQQGVNDNKLYHYNMLQQNQSEGQMYPQDAQQQQRQQQRQQTNYLQQQGLQGYMQPQQQQMMPMEKQQQQNTQFSASNNPALISPMKESELLPSDLNNLNNQELFDAPDLDVSEMLRDDMFNFNLDFDVKNNNYFQNSCQSQMQQSGGFNMANNGIQQQQPQLQQQQTTLQSNPDIFINTPVQGNGNNMVMMMEGCLGNNSHFQPLQQGQASSIGSNASYGMQ